MSGTILPFVSTTSSTLLFEASVVLPFALPTPPPIREATSRLGQSRELLKRGDTQWERANIKWQKAQARRAAATPLHEAMPGDTSEAQSPIVPKPVIGPQFFNSVIRLGTLPQPHPLWRIACGCGRVLDRFMNGFTNALLVFYMSLGLTAFPLFANAHWIGGLAMAMVGSVFGWLLLERWQREHDTVDDSDTALHRFRRRT